MSKNKIVNCPNCQTPIYERIPKCPNCSYIFFEMKPDYGIEIMYDFLFMPNLTIEKYANALLFKSLFFIPIFSAILLFIFLRIHLVLQTTIIELMPWEKLSIDFLIVIVGSILWYFLLLGSISIGLNLWNKPLPWSQIAQIINVSMIGLFYGLVGAIVFKIINVQSVSFIGSAEDYLTMGIAIFFLMLGFILMISSIYKGLSLLTQMAGWKIFFISLLPIVLFILFMLFTLLLFAFGIYFG